MMRGYYTLSTENLTNSKIIEALDLRDRVAKQITVYIEQMMNTYMGVPLFKVWYKQEPLMVSDTDHLLKHGVREAPYNGGA
jgi:hypothetical protein